MISGRRLLLILGTILVFAGVVNSSVIILHSLSPLWWILNAICCGCGICVAVLACSRNLYDLTEGEVVAKRYVAEYWRPSALVAMGQSMGVWMQPMLLDDEACTVCVPAHYYFQLRQGRHTGWVEVTVYDYLAIQEGHYFRGFIKRR
jgi:hypothetical protein